ncbi:MAG TPA: FixH family protein [Polyangiaceae bacterium]|nr:FixH family protein [Polyangiaceae bacterium]
MVHPRLAFVSIFGVLVVLACSSSKSDGTGATTPGDADSGDYALCPSNLPDFHLTMTATGKAGFMVELLDATPQTPQFSAPAGNSWKVKVTGPDGAPVSAAATLKLTCGMAHGNHGCGPNKKETANGDGTFQIDQISFQMTGSWSIGFDVTDGAATDSIPLGICVK